MSGKYDDMLHLPHHVSSKHPQMSRASRAAQFSPFAALTGYDAAVKETARLTDQRIELEEEAKALLDQRLRLLTDRLSEQPMISITYFQPDDRKDGGAYVTTTGTVKKLDLYLNLLIMASGQKIPIGEILSIEGTLFNELQE